MFGAPKKKSPTVYVMVFVGDPYAEIKSSSGWPTSVDAGSLYDAYE
jgi:hypothetical protein